MEIYSKVTINLAGMPREVYIKKLTGGYVKTVWVNKNQACIRRELDSTFYNKGAISIEESEFNQVIQRALNDSV